MFKLSSKGEEIRAMFGAIAPRYDFLNRLLSLGIDQRWRQTAVRQLPVNDGPVLDIATGTGDVALEISRQFPARQVVGVDFCPEMVELGREKVAASPAAGRIRLEVAPCEAIPFPDDTFAAATIAFGIRNVVDREVGLREICRVLRPGGRLVVLEFSTPVNPLFRALYHLYFHRLLPAIGGLFSRYSAYRYLPESVSEFPCRAEFEALMVRAGFCDPRHLDLTGGIASLFLAEKPVGR